MKATAPSASSSSSSSKWAELPHTALLLVLNKLLLLSDIVKFSRICTNWCYVAKNRLKQLNLPSNMPLYRNLPMLFVPNTQRNDPVRNLYSINQHKIYDLNLQVPYKRRCCGSSHGWLITLDSDSFEINLINPFYFGSSIGTICLPRFSAALEMYEKHGQAFNFDYYIWKAILSSDPISSVKEFVLMVIYGETRKLAFWKSGDKNWTHVDWDFHQVFDIIYVHGRFLSVNSLGQVHSCETNVADRPYKVSTLSSSLWAILDDCWRYLVQLPDRTVLKVIRKLEKCTCYEDCPTQNTVGFFIYKMVVDDEGRSGWSEVGSLVDGAIFLGVNQSHYVSASQFPGCRANAIYFTDDCYDSTAMLKKPINIAGPYDIGIYLMEEKRREMFCVPVLGEGDVPFPPPIWILPTI